MAEIVKAKLRYLRISPKKVRRIASLIKGMSVDRAEAELRSRPSRSSPALLGLLKSAINSAVNTYKLDRKSLLIKNVLVDPGPSYKRWLPRAMGRATPILKRTSHVTMILESKSPAPKTSDIKTDKTETPAISDLKKSEKKQSNLKPSAKKEQVKKMNLKGFSPKVFRRKAI
jgi:large subunit ribosomal protein L22